MQLGQQGLCGKRFEACHLVSLNHPGISYFETATSREGRIVGMNVTRRNATIAADKAQDLGVPELHFMVAVSISPSGILLRSLREASLNP